MTRNFTLSRLLACSVFLLASLALSTFSQADALRPAAGKESIRLAATQEFPTIVILGDSLSAAYGMASENGWVSLLEQLLEREQLDYSIVNASISGETSSGGLQRLPALLKRWKPEFVVLELGGNDGLRGTPTKLIRRNLESMIRQSQDAGARILLLGMRIPPNYGPRYTEAFHNQYADLAEKYDTLLVPFFLEDIATRARFMQRDGIHPNEKAQPLMADSVYAALRTEL